MKLDLLSIMEERKFFYDSYQQLMKWWYLVTTINHDLIELWEV